MVARGRTAVVVVVAGVAVAHQRVVTHRGQNPEIWRIEAEMAARLRTGAVDGGDSEATMRRRLQPGGGGGGSRPGGGPGAGGGDQGGDESGSTPSNECDVSDGTPCEHDGSTNYCVPRLEYDAGVFTGEIVTNACNDHPRIYVDAVLTRAATSQCEAQSLPSMQTGALPTLGRAGLMLSGGVNIYSAFEAGFNDCDVQEPCACTGASCDGGMDVATCEGHLFATCQSEVDTTKFMDSCGGHAEPYHIHLNPVCNTRASANGHSALIGVMLDGYGVYGVMETADSRPCDLDACHGHVGPVPADDEYGVPQGESVYHYHFTDQDEYPGTWTPACYGDPDTPVDLDRCRRFYDTCDDGDDVTVVTEAHPNGVTVDLYCPCFDGPHFSECESAPTPKPTPQPTPKPTFPKPTFPEPTLPPEEPTASPVLTAAPTPKGPPPGPPVGNPPTPSPTFLPPRPSFSLTMAPTTDPDGGPSTDDPSSGKSSSKSSSAGFPIWLAVVIALAALVVLGAVAAAAYAMTPKDKLFTHTSHHPLQEPKHPTDDTNNGPRAPHNEIEMF